MSGPANGNGNGNGHGADGLNGRPVAGPAVNATTNGTPAGATTTPPRLRGAR